MTRAASERTIRIDGVWKRYQRGHWVLRGVDVDVEPGSAVVVNGANGAGKSTLIALLSGATLPSRGRLLGRPARISVAPDPFLPPPQMTVRTYVARMASLAREQTSEVDRRILEHLDRFDVQPGIDRTLGQLSKGNQRKVALSIAFGGARDLILLDEPHDGLDAAAVCELNDQIVTAAARGATVLWTAHDAGHETSATHRLVVHAGGVASAPVTRRPTPRADPLMSVVLTAPSDIARSAWVPRSGVISQASIASSDPGSSVHVIVDASSADQFLFEALTHGWSVRDVRSVSESDARP